MPSIAGDDLKVLLKSVHRHLESAKVDRASYKDWRAGEWTLLHLASPPRHWRTGRRSKRRLQYLLKQMIATLQKSQDQVTGNCITIRPSIEAYEERYAF